MRKEYQAKYIAKYSDPLACFIDEHCHADEDYGSIDDHGMWVGLYGHHVMVEDDRGFVARHKLAKDETLEDWLMANHPYFMGDDEDDEPDDLGQGVTNVDGICFRHGTSGCIDPECDPHGVLHSELAQAERIIR